MTDDKILDKTTDLLKSCLNADGKKLMTMIKKYKKAFSLHDEIGECPNIKMDIDVDDDSLFFVRPFFLSEKDKPIHG